VIGYCTNVYAGEGVSAITSALTSFARPVREALGLAEMPVGLWVSARTVAALMHVKKGADDRQKLREDLAAAGIRAATINAFPYGDFHGDVVKHRVYAPDWSLPQRADYTRACCLLLHDLLPPGGRGGVSTLPVAWREGFGEGGMQRSGAALRSLVSLLHELHERSGRMIHVDLEPEPGCVLDSPGDVISYYEQVLLRGVPAQDEARIRRHIRICHDVCHSAVMFVPQADVFAAYAAAGIRIGRVQLSSAPSLDLDGDSAARSRAIEALAAFAEPRWLHQTYALSREGSVEALGDLPEACDRLRAANTSVRSVRTHVHVPVHLAGLGTLSSTRSSVDEAIRLAAGHRDDPLMEVETYAWSALPESLRGSSLSMSAASEIAYCLRIGAAHDAAEPGSGVHAG